LGSELEESRAGKTPLRNIRTGDIDGWRLRKVAVVFAWLRYCPKAELERLLLEKMLLFS